MSVIKLTLPTGESAVTGKQISFVAPCDCSGVTGVQVGSTTYTLVDAMNTSLSSIGSTFCKGALVSVLLDCSNNRAYVLNAGSISCDSSLSSSSTKPVQNKVVQAALADRPTTSAMNTAISNAVADRPTTSAMNTAISNAVSSAGGMKLISKSILTSSSSEIELSLDLSKYDLFKLTILNYKTTNEKYHKLGGFIYAGSTKVQTTLFKAYYVYSENSSIKTLSAKWDDYQVFLTADAAYATTMPMNVEINMYKIGTNLYTISNSVCIDNTYSMTPYNGYSYSIAPSSGVNKLKLTPASYAIAADTIFILEGGKL